MSQEVFEEGELGRTTVSFSVLVYGEETFVQKGFHSIMTRSLRLTQALENSSQEKIPSVTTNCAGFSIEFNSAAKNLSRDIPSGKMVFLEADTDTPEKRAELLEKFSLNESETYFVSVPKDDDYQPFLSDLGKALSDMLTRANMFLQVDAKAQFLNAWMPGLGNAGAAVKRSSNLNDSPKQPPSFFQRHILLLVGLFLATLILLASVATLAPLGLMLTPFLAIPVFFAAVGIALAVKIAVDDRRKISNDLQNARAKLEQQQINNKWKKFGMNSAGKPTNSNDYSSSVYYPAKPWDKKQNPEDQKLIDQFSNFLKTNLPDLEVKIIIEFRGFRQPDFRIYCDSQDPAKIDSTLFSVHQLIASRGMDCNYYSKGVGEENLKRVDFGVGNLENLLKSNPPSEQNNQELKY